MVFEQDIQLMFAARRAQLLSKFDENAVLIIVGNKQKTRSKNIRYHFRPDNDLYYFTGFTEPDAVAVFRPNHSSPFVLFNRAKDPAAETNFGERAGQVGAVEKFAANLAFDIETIDVELPQLLEDRCDIYYLDEQDIYRANLWSWVDKQRKSTGFDIPKLYRRILPLAPIVHQLRVIKSEVEINLIKHAVNASVSGHTEVMKQCRVDDYEFSLEAIFDREIAKFGCRDVAYPSIVASGNNACCLHYEENHSQLKSGNLLLIDAGAEYQLYCSDITRTFPINGKFTDAQKQLYSVVLAAIDGSIAMVKPGLCWAEIHQTCCQIMTQGLIELGILTGSFEENWQNEHYLKYTVHKTGHWLGMDVHDVGRYHDEQGQWLKLVPNMVFTIEPGIYIPTHCTEVDEKWRGIGIRIEDDILVTSSGCEILSANAPRTIEQIEATMANR